MRVRGGLDLVGALLVFLITQVVYVSTLTIECPFWDSGEFIATSYILGIPHPPGTPLYVLIGRIFSMIPFMELVATRVNYLSAFAASAAAAFTFLVTLEFYRGWFRPPGRPDEPESDDERDRPSTLIGFVAGVVAALFVAFSRTYWDNAIEAEVYALSNLIMTVCFWLILRWARPGERNRRTGLFVLLYYLICLSMGIHLGTFLVLPGIILFALVVDRRIFGENYGTAIFISGLIILMHPALLPNLGWEKWVPLIGIVILLSIGSIAYYASSGRDIHPLLGRQGLLTWCCIAAVLGISTHLYLTIRASLDPGINEADPRTFDAFWKVLTRDQYKPPNPFQIRKASWAVQFTTHFWDYARDQYYTGIGPLRFALFFPYILGMIGAIGHAIREKKGFLLMFVTYLIMSVGLVFYLNFREDEVRQRDYFFVASFQFFAIWIGLGVAYLLEELRSGAWSLGRPTRQILIGGLGLTMIVLPFGTMRAGWFEHDRSEFTVASDFAHNVLSSLDPDALIFTNGDNDTFPLWYLQEVEEFRTDVRVVNLSLLNTDWYMRQLRDLEPKVDLGWSDEELSQVMIFSGIMGAYGAGRVSRARLVDFIERTGIRRYVRTLDEPLLTKDVAVARIIEREGRKRPIYLALTVPDRMGLDGQLIQEGIVVRLDLDRKGDRVGMDLDKTLQFLNEEYKFRGVLDENGLRDESIYKDVNSSRLVQNYAASCLTAAQSLLDAGRADDALKISLRGRELAPHAPAVHYSLGVLYRSKGNWVEMEGAFRHLVESGNADARIYNLFSESLERQGRFEEAVASHNETLIQFPGDYDTFRALFRLLWVDMGEFEAGVGVLQSWSRAHPDDASVRQAVQSYADSLARMRGRN